MLDKMNNKEEHVKSNQSVNSIACAGRIRKKNDTDTFTIPCIIRCQKIVNFMYNKGSSINLMSLEVYKSVKLSKPRQTNM